MRYDIQFLYEIMQSVTISNWFMFCGTPCFIYGMIRKKISSNLLLDMNMSSGKSLKK